jgi:hypothetical protein
MSRVNRIRKETERTLLNLPGVAGVGSPKGRLRVYVESLNPVEEELPSTVQGVPVEVVEIGKLYALPLLYQVMSQQALLPLASTDPRRTDRVRPVLPGVSIGHIDTSAGTLGSSLRFLGYDLGLSNDHVLANSNTLQNTKAEIGDPILQPGPYDGGTIEDRVGDLALYVPLDEEGPNLVDMACFKPSSPEILDDEILEIGVPTGVGKAELDSIVQKSGRTTGYTQANVLDVDATVKVEYGGFEASFENQIITDYMSDPGDSGSLLLDGDNKAVGLLFAGSNIVTVHNHMGNVVSFLKEGGVPGEPVSPSEASKLFLSSFIPVILGVVLLR